MTTNDKKAGIGSGTKYLKKVPTRGETGKSDIYCVIVAWNVTDPGLQHCLKKILMPGQRGDKQYLKDLKEARDALDAAIEFAQKEEIGSTPMSIPKASTKMEGICKNSPKVGDIWKSNVGHPYQYLYIKSFNSVLDTFETERPGYPSYTIIRQYSSEITSQYVYYGSLAAATVWQSKIHSDKGCYIVRVAAGSVEMRALDTNVTYNIPLPQFLAEYQPNNPNLLEIK